MPRVEFERSETGSERKNQKVGPRAIRFESLTGHAQADRIFEMAAKKTIFWGELRSEANPRRL